jgi:hypothetical protein
MTEIDRLVKAAFSGPRTPRSKEYKAGVRAALEFRMNGAPVREPCPPGTAAYDAFFAGVNEGHDIWRLIQRGAYAA